MSISYENNIRKCGRSSSQRSIYDYPEHLNPFYEDENHKRLRFWKLGSSSKAPSRSSSFSLDGLKGLWSFKSFRLKKKSSTLGINKTSESPPMLRHVTEQPFVNRSCTGIDSQFRHTVDIGLCGNFDRRARYRSSLQDFRTIDSQENGFSRNNRYRSTLQNVDNRNPSFVSPSKYSANGTATIRTTYIPPGLSRGSSRTSLNSTNPFDDDCADKMSQISGSDTASVRRSGRKKRKAPAPPSPPAKPIHQVVKSDDTLNISEQTNNDAHHDEAVNISNLTAEIESFVKIADTDNADIGNKSNSDNKELHIQETSEKVSSSAVAIENNNTVVTKTESNVKPNGKVNVTVATKLTDLRQSPENNEYYPVEKDVVVSADIRRTTTTEKLQNVVNETDVNNVQRSKKSPVKILIRSPTDADNENQEQEFSIDTLTVTDNSVETPISSAVDEILENALRERDRILREISQEQGEGELTDEQATSSETTKSPTNIPEVTQITIETSSQSSVKQSTSAPSSSPKKPVNKLKETNGFTCHTSVSTASDFSTTNQQNAKTSDEIPVTSLKITESTDNLTKTPSPELPLKVTIFEVRNVPLKGFSPGMARKEIDLRKTEEEEKFHEDVELRNKSKQFNWSTPPTTPPATPPKRRFSVKEIIDSINKSQSLLKINQESNQLPNNTNRFAIRNTFPKPVLESSNNEWRRTTNGAKVTSKPEEKIDVLTDTEKLMKKMIADLESDRDACKSDSSSDIPLFVEQFYEMNNNNDELFPKCSVKREQSPNSLLDSIDWNPLPKPRRSKNSPH